MDEIIERVVKKGLVGEVSEEETELRSQFHRYNDLGTFGCLKQMAELCQTIMQAYETDETIIFNKRLHKAVRCTDVLFEMIVDAWIEHELKRNDSESPKLTQETQNEAS